MDDCGGIRALDSADDAINVAQPLRFTGENAVIGNFTMMGTGVEDASDDHHKRGEEHAELKEPAHNGFHAAIVETLPAFWSDALFFQNHLVTPLTIISNPRARITKVKIVRSIDTCARTR